MARGETVNVTESWCAAGAAFEGWTEEARGRDEMGADEGQPRRSSTRKTPGCGINPTESVRRISRRHTKPLSKGLGGTVTIGEERETEAEGGEEEETEGKRAQAGRAGVPLSTTTASRSPGLAGCSSCSTSRSSQKTAGKDTKKRRQRRCIGLLRRL